jgi:hypothetical protein
MNKLNMSYLSRIIPITNSTILIESNVRLSHVTFLMLFRATFLMMEEVASPKS